VSLIEYEDAEVEETIDHVEEILSLLGIYAPPMADDGWKKRAACRDKGPAIFFPEDAIGKGRAKTNGYKEARRICQGCPVREECAQAGRHERFGVWGGMSENERHPKRRSAQ
jgi:WhiB family redox-sensing transcriptional regulator